MGVDAASAFAFFASLVAIVVGVALLYPRGALLVAGILSLALCVAYERGKA